MKVGSTEFSNELDVDVKKAKSENHSHVFGLHHLKNVLSFTEIISSPDARTNTVNICLSA